MGLVHILKAAARVIRAAVPVAVELTGFALLGVAGWMVTPALGVAVAGASLVFLAQGMGGSA